VQDCINFLFPGLKAMGCEPIAEPVCFLDGPFTLKRIKLIHCHRDDGEQCQGD
jgi:hypothetical protein